MPNGIEKPQLIQVGIPGWLQPKKQDRGLVFTEETIERALSLLERGWSLAGICREQPGMPSVYYLRRWLLANPENERRYREAQRIGAELLADEMIDIADGACEGDVIMEDVQRSILRINTRKWLLSIRNPKVYADKGASQVNVNIDLGKAMSEGMRRVEHARQGGLIEGVIE